MSRSFRVVCIDDKRRPKEVPTDLWVEQEEPYTVVMVSNMAHQPGVYGFTLAEIQLPAMCPYQVFDSRRFRPMTEDDVEAMEAVRKLLEEVEELELLTID